jgi:hypothetical protein
MPELGLERCGEGTSFNLLVPLCGLDVSLVLGTYMRESMGESERLVVGTDQAD